MSILRGHFISLDALEQRVIENTDSVFVHLGCYNKTPQSGWLIENRNLFFIVLKRRSPRSRGQPFGGGPLLRSDDFSLCPHMTGQGSSLGPFIRSSFPFMKVPPSWPNRPQRPGLFIASHRALGVCLWLGVGLVQTFSLMYIDFFKKMF